MSELAMHNNACVYILYIFIYADHRSGRSPRPHNSSSPRAALGQSAIFKSGSVNHSILDEIVVKDVLVRSDRDKETRSPGPGHYVSAASPLGREAKGYTFGAPATPRSQSAGRSRGAASPFSATSNSNSAALQQVPGSPRLAPVTTCVRGDVLFYKTERPQNIDVLGPGSYSPNSNQSSLLKPSFNARAQTPTRSRPSSSSSPAMPNNNSNSNRPRSGSASRRSPSGSNNPHPHSPTFARAAFSPYNAMRPSGLGSGAVPISPIFRDRQAAGAVAAGDPGSTYWNRYETGAATGSPKH